MSKRPPMPDKTFMLAALRSAIHLHDDALDDATPMQIYVADARKFIEEARPFDVLSLECVNLLDTALVRMIRHSVPPETALRYAKRIHKKFKTRRVHRKPRVHRKRKPGRVRAGRV
jgi:hypothetical protein